MSKTEMQFDKSSGTSATPFFNSDRRGQTQGRIGSVTPAGGEVRPDRYIGGPLSTGVTHNIGADTPTKARGI
jgi:hypothetical protein